MSSQTQQSQHQNSHKKRFEVSEILTTLFRYTSSVIVFLSSIFVGYLLVRIFIESQNPGGLGALALAGPVIFIMIAGSVLTFAIVRFGVGRYLLRESSSTSFGNIIFEFVLWSTLLVVSVYVASDLWFWQLFEDICDPLCIYLLP